MIRLRNVTKSYGEKTVLRDFSLELPCRGAVALMGPSGCGKTTLLRLIAGLEAPDSGEVLLPESPKISVVFQEDRLLEAFSVRENVLAVLPDSQAGRAEADRCLLRCGLDDVAASRPESLSGGMRRRVAIARAMAFGGNILLLDEPFKGLDDATRQSISSFVFENSGKRLTILVTHDSAEAREYCGDILAFTGIPLELQGEIK